MNWNVTSPLNTLYGDLGDVLSFDGLRPRLSFDELDLDRAIIIDSRSEGRRAAATLSIGDMVRLRVARLVAAEYSEGTPTSDNPSSTFSSVNDSADIAVAASTAVSTVGSSRIYTVSGPFANGVRGGAGLGVGVARWSSSRKDGDRERCRGRSGISRPERLLEANKGVAVRAGEGRPRGSGSKNRELCCCCCWTVGPVGARTGVFGREGKEKRAGAVAGRAAVAGACRVDGRVLLLPTKGRFLPLLAKTSLHRGPRYVSM